MDQEKEQLPSEEIVTGSVLEPGGDISSVGTGQEVGFQMGVGLGEMTETARGKVPERHVDGVKLQEADEAARAEGQPVAVEVQSETVPAVQAIENKVEGPGLAAVVDSVGAKNAIVGLDEAFENIERNWAQARQLSESALTTDYYKDFSGKVENARKAVLSGENKV